MIDTTKFWLYSILTQNNRGLYYWDPELSELLLALDGDEHSIESVAISHDGSEIFSGAESGFLKKWSSESD